MLDRVGLGPLFIWQSVKLQNGRCLQPASLHRYFSGGVVSVAVLIGFISLFGIATRNGIMMVTHIQHLWNDSIVKTEIEAVSRGAEERLSPILMTALSSGLALLPLVFRAGHPGSEILTPMAIVILCGLLTSTVLNLVVVPVLYLKFGRPLAELER